MIKELKSYSNNEWGLCVPTLEEIIKIIKNNQVKSIIEFGSGKSTEFLIDVRNEMNLDYTIDSFDDSEKYCYNEDRYDYLNLKVTDLIVCGDEDYLEMFNTKTFNRNKFTKVDGEFDAKIKNATYDVNFSELKDNYDLVIIDGPHGNGRNFSNFYIKNRIKNGTYIIIDDYFSYNFVETVRYFFDVEVIEEKIFEGYSHKGHAILKVIK
jgi:hypothetical protein